MLGPSGQYGHDYRSEYKLLCGVNSENELICWNNENQRFLIEKFAQPIQQLVMQGAVAYVLLKDGSLIEWFLEHYGDKKSRYQETSGAPFKFILPVESSNSEFGSNLLVIDGSGNPRFIGWTEFKLGSFENLIFGAIDGDMFCGISDKKELACKVGMLIRLHQL